MKIVALGCCALIIFGMIGCENGNNDTDELNIQEESGNEGLIGIIILAIFLLIIEMIKNYNETRNINFIEVTQDAGIHLYTYFTNSEKNKKS